VSTPDDPSLDACGCGADAATDASPPLDNRPGLTALAWRAGTYAAFFARMKARLPSYAIVDGDGAGQRPLVDLGTRAPDDPSIAILDAWSVAADILTFYTERIANEGYLRTAVERRSVLEIARTIGYELSPGVAASTYLAFAVDDPPFVPSGLAPPTEVALPSGTKVQSLPGKSGELPQTFETIAATDARVVWNAMRPRQRVRHELQVLGTLLVWVDPKGNPHQVARLWLAGDYSSLKPGERLLVQASHYQGPLAKPTPLGETIVVVKQAIVERPADPTKPTYTRVELVAPSGPDPGLAWPWTPAGTPTTTPLAMTAEVVASVIMDHTWTEEALSTFLSIQGWDPDALLDQVQALLDGEPAPAEIHHFTARTGVFGHNAPYAPSVILAAANPQTSPWANWDDPDDPTTAWQTSGSPPAPGAGEFPPPALERARQPVLYSKLYGVDLLLERSIDIAAGGWALLEASSASPVWYRVKSARDVARADFSLSGKATGLSFGLTDQTKTSGPLTKFHLRTTVVHAASEELPMATAPLADRVGEAGDTVSALMLDRMVLGLAVGQVVAISGATVDEHGAPTGATASELATLAQVRHVAGYTVLDFAAALANAYTRSSMTLNANVAPATHGETVANELLGSGDASLAGQQFTFKRPPVTYVSAATPSGRSSSVAIAVNGVAWTEVPSLYEAGPDDRVYVLRTDDGGVTTAQFGDGVHGARLPTGSGNVTATYRTGIGFAGQVAAGKLTILPQKPLGIRSASNPTAATGAADAEHLDDARRAAPLTVMTLDRVVSRRDYEDFARSFAGVGKAVASEIWSGTRRLVHVTIAGASAGPVATTSALYKHLRAAIARASDGLHAFEVDSYRARYFRVGATLTVAADHDRDDVLAAALADLLGRYGFAARDLGQPVTQSELIAALQAIEGVVAVTLTRFEAVDEPSDTPRSAIAAPSAHWDAAQGVIVPAALLTIARLGVELAATGGSS
jgi:predicted phage baseplate assembly protein